MSLGKVSVCIPVYNGDRYIYDTVKSVMDQTYKNIEILIQDNASTDRTEEIINSMSEIDARIIVDNNDELVSMAANWNVVCSRATGDYLVLLSADDLLEPTFIKECIDIFRDHEDVSVVSTEHYLLTDRGIRKRKVSVDCGKRKMSSSEILLKNPFSINFTMFDLNAIRKTFIGNRLMFREPYYTCDYDLWIRLAINCNTVYFIEKPLAKYRVHGDSLSTNGLKMIKHTVLVLLANKKELKNSNGIIYRATLIRLLLRMVRIYLKNRCFDKRLAVVILKEVLR